MRCTGRHYGPKPISKNFLIVGHSHKEGRKCCGGQYSWCAFRIVQVFSRNIVEVCPTTMR
jgi:hypothetical protein